MASFLDNTGDIVLDAVLTDYGRQLLAKGDGSFNITKFALGDDEIDYGLFDLTASSPNQDTLIMNTPILEAFTNNAASLKSKLLTINIENLLYLPVIKLNNLLSPTGSFVNNFNGFVVPVIQQTAGTGLSAEENSFRTNAAGNYVDGVLNLSNVSIKIDQGLDNSSTDRNSSLANTIPELFEREYNIQLDFRLGRVKDLSPVSVDDDGMAIYRVTADNTVYVAPIPLTDNSKVIAGNQGTRLTFTVEPQNILANSDSYFQTLGDTSETIVAGSNHKIIRTSVKVTGVTTGYSIDIPILFAKKV